MSSFRRIKASSAPAPPPGTILFPSVSLPHLSTGLASLDDVLAPGQPLSSALLILTPDAHSAWGKLMQRYWISQGLLGGQGVVVVGGEGEGEDLVEGAMWEAKKQPDQKAEESASDGEGLEEEEEVGKKKIAWRYGGMGKFKTTVESSSSSANSFNYTLSLTHHIPRSTLAALKASGQLAYVVARPGSRKGKGKEEAVEGSELDRVLLELKRIIEEGDYSYASTSKQPARALRIALPNLFSTSYGDVSMTQMYRFLHSLRSLLRSSRTAAMITLPAHLCQKSELRERLMWGTDAVVELEGFGSDPTLPLLFPSHHGLLHLHSPFHLSSLSPPSAKLSTLVGGRGGQNNLAFKLKRKAFVVETLHLDVEGGVGERRTTAPVALGGGEDPHAGHGHEGHEHGHGETEEVQLGEGAGRVRIEVSQEEREREEKKERETVLPRKSAMKKKTVGFAGVDPTKPELYEF
ncbi:Elongator complex protein 4 [Mrakia frigida]|uniref:Elongator complex protein 4 n=1 Tax=Mrakia frigida TaxID=29902 RepID=UPI003FCC26C9